jgi:hypothetical protein
MSTRHKFKIDSDWEVMDIVADIIAIYLDPDSHIPAHHVTLQIDDLRPDRRMHEDGEEIESIGISIINLWPVVLEIGKQVPCQSNLQKRLVELVEALLTTHTTSLEVCHNTSS